MKKIAEFFKELFTPSPQAPKPPPDPTKVWEYVNDGELVRIRVPGGWIYRRVASGTTRAMCFVPFPEKKEKKK